MYQNKVGRDSPVGIATCYGLDRPGNECQWRRDFPHPSRPYVGPTMHPEGIHVALLGVCKFRENGRKEGRSFVTGGMKLDLHIK